MNNIPAIEVAIKNRKEKITKLQKEIADLTRQKESAENAQIIAVIRKANVSVQDLTEALSLISSDNKEKNTDKEKTTK